MNLISENSLNKITCCKCGLLDLDLHRKHALIFLVDVSCEGESITSVVFPAQFHFWTLKLSPLGNTVPKPHRKPQRTESPLFTQVGVFRSVEAWRHHSLPFPCKGDRVIIPSWKMIITMFMCCTGPLQTVASWNRTSTMSGLGSPSFFKVPDFCRFFLIRATSTTVSGLFFLSTFSYS